MRAHVAILGSFLPDVGIALVSRGLHPSRADEFECGVLFADIAGFTPLAERLAAEGAEGAEELARHLNLVFGRLTDHVRAHGGDTVKFAGDALLAIWPADSDDENVAAATLRAARCALSIPSMLEKDQRAEDLRLSVKLSVASGRVMVAALGGLRDRFELFVAGDPLAEAARAHVHAPTGTVALSEQASILLAGLLPGTRPGKGSYLVPPREAEKPTRPVEHPRPNPNPGTERGLRSLVPGAIRAHLDAGLSEWIAELRRLTILFIHLPELSANPGIARAQTAISTLQRVLYRYEGSLNKINVDDKGVSVLAALGLPPLFHTDDALRGTRAALDAERELAREGFETSIGVTTGSVFCGAVGGEHRCEYTIMGDPVNLAARLMTSYPQGVYCDAATVKQAGAKQCFEYLETLHVKGKTTPVPVHRALRTDDPAARPRRDRELALVGREVELARLTELARAWLENPGHPTAAVLEGSTGMGKSALASAFAASSSSLGIEALSASADALERGTPYFAWRPIAQNLLGLDPNASLAERRTRIEEWVAAIGRDVEDAPLLGALLPLGEWETDRTRALEPRQRAEQIREMMCEALAHRSQQGPVLLLIEDVHWLDSASWALLHAAAERERGAWLLLTRRPEEREALEGLEELGRRVGIEALRIEPLSSEHVAEIVRRRLGLGTLSPELHRAVAERAEGNPLFAEELALALRERRASQGETPLSRLAPEDELPPTLEAALTQRIDQLTAEEQLALKVASVVGYEFSLDLLRHVYPVDTTSEILSELCEALHRRDLTTPTSQSGPVAYRFKSRTVQDVAYRLMLFSQRRTLHRHVAEWYERHAEDRTALHAVLAHHWLTAAREPSRDPDLAIRALGHLESAAAHAVYSYANHDAIRLCREALDLLNQLADDGRAASRELALRLSLGGALVSATSWGNPEVDLCYRRAQELAALVGTTEQQFQAVRGRWQFCVGTGAYAEAERLGHELLGVSAHSEDARLRIETHRMLGNTAFWLGNLESARERLRTAVELAAPDESEFVSLGQDPEVSNRGILAWVLCLMGEPDAGLEQIRRAIDRARSLDHPFTLAFAYGSAMWVHVFLRQVDLARTWAERTLGISQEHEFAYLETAAHVVRGWATALSGERGGVTEIEAAIEHWRTTAASIGLPMFLATLADAYLSAERVEEARVTLQDPVLVERGASEGWLEPLLHCLNGLVLQACGSAGAGSALRQAACFARSRGARLIEARALKALQLRSCEL